MMQFNMKCFYQKQSFLKEETVAEAIMCIIVFYASDLNFFTTENYKVKTCDQEKSAVFFY